TVSISLRLSGSLALSEFRRERLLSRLQQLEAPVAAVQAHYVHFVHTQEPLSAEDHERLEALLTYGDPAPEELDGLHLLVIPRLGTISPWASKATDIAHNCGLHNVHRIERAVRYTVVPQRGWLGERKI